MINRANEHIEMFNKRFAPSQKMSLAVFCRFILGSKECRVILIFLATGIKEKRRKQTNNIKRSSRANVHHPGGDETTRGRHDDRENIWEGSIAVNNHRRGPAEKESVL